MNILECMIITSRLSTQVYTFVRENKHPTCSLGFSFISHINFKLRRSVQAWWMGEGMGYGALFQTTDCLLFYLDVALYT